MATFLNWLVRKNDQVSDCVGERLIPKYSSNLPLAIIGGGLAGLALARACSLRGISCNVLEQAPELREVGSAILLGMNAYRVLTELGIDEEILKKSATIEQAELRNAKGKLLTQIPLGSLGRDLGLKTIVCHRAHLQSVLAASLANTILHTGWSAESIQLHGNEVVIRNNNGQFFNSNIVAGCDGIHGITRKLVTPFRKPRYSGSTCWRGIVNVPSHSIVDYGVMTEYIGPGCRFGASWIEPGRIGWYLTSISQSGMHDNPHGLTDRLAKLVEGWHPAVLDLIRCTQSHLIHRNDLSDLSIPTKLHRGPVVLLGDAAHAMLPNLGQGGAAALEDASSLAQCLANFQDIQQALRHYQYVRHHRCRMTQTLSRYYGIIFQRPNSVECWIRDKILSMVPKRAMTVGYTFTITGKMFLRK